MRRVNYRMEQCDEHKEFPPALDEDDFGKEGLALEDRESL